MANGTSVWLRLYIFGCPSGRHSSVTYCHVCLVPGGNSTRAHVLSKLDPGTDYETLRIIQGLLVEFVKPFYFGCP